MKNYILVLFASLLSLSGCKSDVKVQGNYIDLTGEVIKVHPDKSLTRISVKIPAATRNTTWSSSNFSLSGVPKNILVNSNFTQVKNYNLYNSAGLENSRSPVIYNNMLYVLNDRGTIYAYDRLNLPNILWQKDLNTAGNEFLGGGIATNGKYIAVTYGNRELVLLNATTGDEIWRHNLSNISRIAPSIYKKSVLALTADNKLYCVGLENGSLNWIHEEVAEEFGMMGAASPTGAEDMIISPYLSGHLGGLDLATGKQNWNRSLQNESQAFLNDVSVSPVIEDSTIYTANYGGTLSAINVHTGHIDWSHKNGGGGSSLWIAGNFIYSINKDSQLLAVYKETGTVKWIYDLPQNQDLPIKFSGPVLINSQLYVASSEGKIIIVSPSTGQKIRDIKIPYGSYAIPIAIDNSIYLLSSSGTLSVIN